MSDDDKVVRDDTEWRALLSEDQYRITRQHGTERPFTGPYLNEKAPGQYRCICCDAELFSSDAKYDSGSGWPSFSDKSGAISEHTDVSHMMRRTEIRCARCAAHLGHVFPDGPGPTGLRYCVNGTSLKFAPKDDR